MPDRATTKPSRLHLLSAGLAALLAVLLTTGCAQRLTVDSELSTRVTNLKDAAKCRHLGNTRVTTKTRFYSGDKKTKIADALLVQARNLAHEVGADTVVPASEIDDGEQHFKLYICRIKS